MILNDRWILEKGEELIDPFVEEPVRENHWGPVISYGVSSFGYDIRLASEFKYYSSEICDPKAIEYYNFNLYERGTPFNLLPGQFVLAKSVETIHMPDDVFAVCFNKSTWARTGLMVNVTPLEPGWSGEITLELTNPTRHAITLYPGEGIAQLVFFEGQEAPLYNYKNKNNGKPGKYQDQKGVVGPKV